MALDKSANVVWMDFSDGSAVNFAVGNASLLNKLSGPSTDFFVVVIIVVHAISFGMCCQRGVKPGGPI